MERQRFEAAIAALDGMPNTRAGRDGVLGTSDDDVLDDSLIPDDAPRRWAPGSKIAIVYLSGDMIDGESRFIPFVGLRLAGSRTIAEALRETGRSSTPYSSLSRGLAGFAGRTLVVNLPGSKGGVRDGIAVLQPLITHLFDLARGSGHE